MQACLHVDGGAEPLLLDCGATSLIALKRLGIDPASIGWVALSHLHGDHFAGLPWLTEWKDNGTLLDRRGAASAAAIMACALVALCVRLELLLRRNRGR